MKKRICGLALTAFMISMSACGVKLPGSKSNSTKPLTGSTVSDSPAPYPVSDAERSASIDQLVGMRKTMRILEGKMIAPAQEDIDQYAEFLKDPSTGLARIFPRDRGNERRPLLINGEGAYYQFKGRTNDYGYGNDIEYDSTNSPTFSVGFAGVDFGFFGEIGQTDIRQVTNSNSVVDFALDYKSPDGQDEPTWRNEYDRWQTGVSNAGVTYVSRVAATVGMTYVVRSISEGSYDVAVVFQVVRRDATDGSLILAWRLVKEFNQPILPR